MFFLGMGISTIGGWMQSTALAWLVVDLTHSPVAVGVLGFCRFIPFTLLGLPAGVVSDRLDNLWLVRRIQVASMVVSFALAVYAFAGGGIVWPAYALALIAGVVDVFGSPSRQTLTFQMVGREDLISAVALSGAVYNASRVVGPAVAGGAIAIAGAGWCFVANGLSFLAVIAALALVRVEELVPVQRMAKATMLRGIQDGLSFARRTKRVGGLLLLAAAITAFGFNQEVLVPLLASETLQTGPVGFGVLVSCFGAGAVAGGLVAASTGRATLRKVAIGSAGIGASLLVLAPVDNVVVGAVVLSVTGYFLTTWATSNQTILQLSTPDHLRGRVISLERLATFGVAPLGSLVAGTLAGLGGTTLALVVAGCATLVATAIVVVELRRRGPAPARVRDEPLA